MSYQIDQRKVNGVALEANLALSGKGFNHGEIIIGLAELTARIIVDAAETPIQAGELVKVVMAHIDRTITVGSHATGKSIIARA